MVPFHVQAVKGKKIAKRKQTLKFTIDCAQPVDDGIMDAAAFVRALPSPHRHAHVTTHLARPDADSSPPPPPLSLLSGANSPP